MDLLLSVQPQRPQPTIFHHLPGLVDRPGMATAPSSRSSSPTPHHIPDAQATYPLTRTLSGPRNIVVFGTSGAGKSSMINMLTNAPGHEDQKPAKVDNSASGVTEKVQKYHKIIHGDQYTVFDTPGLHEGQGGKVPMEQALTQFHDLLVSQPAGIHLLVLVIKGGRITAADEHNYLLAKYLCSDNVPLLFVFTGLENEVGGPAGWWKKQPEEVRYRYARASGHVCITTIVGRSGCYKEEYQDSKKRLDDSFSLVSLSARKGCPVETIGRMSTGFKLIIEYIRGLRKRASGESFHAQLSKFLVEAFEVDRWHALWFTTNVKPPGNFYRIADQRAHSTSRLPTIKRKLFSRS